MQIIEKMGIFDIFNTKKSKTTSIDLTDYKFLSDNHTRIENGKPINADNKGAWRGIRIKTSDNRTYFVTMYNMNENHPVWGDNIQMAEKKMKLFIESDDKIILQGFGKDSMGSSFADYGITLYKSNGDIKKVTLHMHERNIDIVYEKADGKKQSVSLNHYSDFDDFKTFTYKWNTSISTNEKILIASQTDTVNNRGVEAYNNGDIRDAIIYFVQALRIMPNNDDALKNLKLCYTKICNYSKANEMQKKLDYLS